nr:hypothetical protein [Tanacetum cinerariifolium]
MDVGNLNMGPRKGFKVLKQARGSFDKVGATETDSKNYKRDIDLFIGEGDAHMAIEKLEKKELLPDFSYELMQGEDKKLSGLFWADETTKRNYIALGDIVGFDATFRTQKYFMVFVPFTEIDNHQRSVTFGARLISNENSGFLERINDIVWSKTLTPEQFELKWASLMNEYDQQEHKWLSDMYDIHDSWIPSYFRDLPLAGLMQTTSRCEGENYFFGLLTNTDLFLVEFINHFETAMNVQRNIQRNNDHDSQYKAPQLRTSFQFEKEVVGIFTIAAFKVIQSQIVKSMIFCMSYNVTDIEGGQEYFIEDVDDDVKLRSDFQDKQKELMDQVFDDMPYQPPMKNKQVIETILGVTQPDEIKIGNPNISSNKGGIGDEEDQQKKLEAQKKSEANNKHGANHQASTSGSEV